MPAWALKYKTKGHTIRYQSGNFYLVKVSSVRVKDKPYPKVLQEFIGIITEENGLIPKKVSLDEHSLVSTLEFGLSNFLFHNFKRDLKRHISNDDGAELLITATIIQFMFSDIHDDYLKLTLLPKITGINSFELLTPRRIKVVERLLKRIETALDEAIPKQQQRRFLFELRNITLLPDADIHKDIYPQSLKTQIEKWGFRYGKYYD